MKCRDCKWFQESHFINPINNKAVRCYVCICKNKRRWHKMKYSGYQIMEPSHSACRTGFEPKEE